MHFLICAPAQAKTWGSGLVPAPWVKRALEKQFDVPHSSFTPVSRCREAASFTMRSRRSFVSLRLSPSGEMSRSWKAQNGTPSLVKNSKAARIVSSAASMGSPEVSQGRS